MALRNCAAPQTLPGVLVVALRAREVELADALPVALLAARAERREARIVQAA